MRSYLCTVACVTVGLVVNSSNVVNWSTVIRDGVLSPEPFTVGILGALVFRRNGRTGAWRNEDSTDFP